LQVGRGASHYIQVIRFGKVTNPSSSSFSRNSYLGDLSCTSFFRITPWAPINALAHLEAFWSSDGRMEPAAACHW
jgi:hypothetical protein